MARYKRFKNGNMQQVFSTIFAPSVLNPYKFAFLAGELTGKNPQAMTRFLMKNDIMNKRQ